MTPSTSPAPPTNPMDSPNIKDASIATVKDWESIIWSSRLNFKFKLAFPLVKKVNFNGGK